VCLDRVPVHIWGTVRPGPHAGSSVIVCPAVTGGWDIYEVPPPPSREVWNH